MGETHRRTGILALILVAVLIGTALSLLVPHSMTADDTTWKSPSADNATTGDGFEVNPSYAYADDNLTAANYDGAGDSHIFYSYSLNVPAEATIKGIEVALEWHLDSDNGTSSMSVALSWNGGAGWTPAATDNVESTSEHRIVLGGPANNWSRSWTPEDLSNSNFRVRVSCNSDNTDRDFFLEWVPVRVWYSPVAWLEVTGTAAMTAGTSNELTITARDADGNVAINYNGLKSLTFSGPAVSPGGQIPAVEGISLGAATSVNFTNGVSDAGAGTLIAYRAESTTVDVFDGTIDSTGNDAYDLDLAVNAASAGSVDLSPEGGAITAGSPFTVIVTAYDAYLNVATGYTGTVHFASSDSGATLPPDYTFVAGDNGTRTFTNGVTLVTFGSQTVAVTDTVNGGLTDTETWSVGAASAASLDLSPEGGSASAGSPFTITVTAKDAYGNTATGYTGAVHFASSDSGATLPSDYTFVAGDNGSRTFTNGVTLVTSGSQTVAVTDTINGGLTDTETWIVGTGSAHHIVISPDTTTITAGSTQPYTAQAFDQFNNSLGDVTASTLFSIETGAGGSWATNVYTSQYAGSWTVTGNYTGLIGTATLNVNPASAASLDLSPEGGSASAGSPFTITVTAKDAYGNTATGYTGAVHFASSDSGATLPSDYTFVAGDNGSRTFTNGVTLVTSGSQTVAVTDTINGGLTDTETWSVGAASATSLDLSPEGGSASAGSPFTVTVTAKDAYGNTVTGYTGTVHFTCSDGSATLPSDYAFVPGDNGSHTFTNGITLITVGTQTVTVTDTLNGALTDTESWSVSGGTIHHYTVTSDNYTQEVSVPFTVTVTAYDAYGNIVTSDSSTLVTLTSSSPSVVFDSNGNGLFGEEGDNIKSLSSGTLDIQAKDTSGAYSVVVTATDGNMNTGTSLEYTVEDFRCFIATAVFGTPMAEEIQALRDFRDAYLNTHPPGRWFVAAYYKCSPPIARFIAGNDFTRTVVRAALVPVIWIAGIMVGASMAHKVFLVTVFFAGIGAFLVLLHRIKKRRRPAG